MTFKEFLDLILGRDEDGGAPVDPSRRSFFKKAGAAGVAIPVGVGVIKNELGKESEPEVEPEGDKIEYTYGYHDYVDSPYFRSDPYFYSPTYGAHGGVSMRGSMASEPVWLGGRTKLGPDGEMSVWG